MSDDATRRAIDRATAAVRREAQARRQDAPEEDAAASGSAREPLDGEADRAREEAGRLRRELDES